MIPARTNVGYIIKALGIKARNISINDFSLEYYVMRTILCKRGRKYELKRATSATAVEISRCQSGEIRTNVKNARSNEMWND